MRSKTAQPKQQDALQLRSSQITTQRKCMRDMMEHDLKCLELSRGKEKEANNKQQRHKQKQYKQQEAV
jgi:hypothetical protein